MVRSIVFYCLSFVLFSCENYKNGLEICSLEYTLDGNVKGFKDSLLIYLSGSENDFIDSTFIINGHFTFHGLLKDSIASKYIVHTKGFDDYKFLWLENKTITFSAQKGKFLEAKIIGSETESISQKVDAEIKPLLQALDSLNEQEQIKGEDLTAQRRVLLNEISNRKIQFIATYPKSIVSISILSTHCRNWGRDQTSALFDMIPDSLRRTSYGRIIESYLTFATALSIGDTIVATTILNSSGTLIHLSDFKGKIVLLDFWASWCGPCRKDNLLLIDAYNTLHASGFEIVSFSLDRDRVNWTRAIEKDNIRLWQHAIELDSMNQHIPEIYSVSDIPDNFLIDGHGILVARNLRGQALKDSVKHMLR